MLKHTYPILESYSLTSNTYLRKWVCHVIVISDNLLMLMELFCTAYTFYIFKGPNVNQPKPHFFREEENSKICCSFE